MPAGWDAAAVPVPECTPAGWDAAEPAEPLALPSAAPTAALLPLPDCEPEALPFRASRSSGLSSVHSAARPLPQS